MRLLLHVIAYRNQPPEAHLSMKFGEEGGTLGRSADNDWVLPDPAHFISGRHAAFYFQDGRFYITDTSTNGVYIGDSDQPLGRGNNAVLAHGDRLLIGDYEVEINVEESPQAHDEALPPVTGTAPTTENFFDAAPLPEDLGLHEFEEPVIPEQPTEPIAPEPPGPISTPLPEAASEPDHVAAVNEFFQPPQTIPDNWEELEATKPIPERTLPEEPPPAADSIPTPKAAAPSASLSDDPAALRALLEGAGMQELEIAPEAAADALRIAGELIREMTGGLMEVLRARTEIKSEFRMQITTLHPEKNNPLKFSVNVEEALGKLLSVQRVPGFLEPKQAIREAVQNIEAHQVATLAGLEAALKKMFDRFDPARLEQEFSEASLVDSLVPAHRKSKCWDVFTKNFRRIAQEAEDDFQQLFTREFVRAYEEQIRQLKSDPDSL